MQNAKFSSIGSYSRQWARGYSVCALYLYVQTYVLGWVGCPHICLVQLWMGRLYNVHFKKHIFWNGYVALTYVWCSLGWVRCPPLAKLLPPLSVRLEWHWPWHRPQPFCHSAIPPASSQGKKQQQQQHWKLTMARKNYPQIAQPRGFFSFLSKHFVKNANRTYQETYSLHWEIRTGLDGGNCSQSGLTQKSDLVKMSSMWCISKDTLHWPQMRVKTVNVNQLYIYELLSGSKTVSSLWPALSSSNYHQYKDSAAKIILFQQKWSIAAVSQ